MADGLKAVDGNQNGTFFRSALASGGAFPYGAKTVPFIRITPTGVVTTAQTSAGKYLMLVQAKDEDLILAVWPGNWASDVFLIDDREEAKARVA